MAKTASTRLDDDDYQRDIPHVDVTCTVGRIYVGQTGDMSVEEAAFLLIAQHGAEGEYHVPGPHEGSETVVEVRRVGFKL